MKDIFLGLDCRDASPIKLYLEICCQKSKNSSCFKFLNSWVEMDQKLLILCFKWMYGLSGLLKSYCYRNYHAKIEIGRTDTHTIHNCRKSSIKKSELNIESTSRTLIKHMFYSLTNQFMHLGVCKRFHQSIRAPGNGQTFSHM